MNNEPLDIYVFCCATGYDQAQMMQGFSRRENTIKVVSLPCSGKLDILYVIKAFETGADGAAVLMCKEGECRYLEGNMRARKRAEMVGELLKEAGLGEGRVAVIQMDDGGIEKKMRELEDFCSKIAALPRASQAKALRA
jgi:F420-non-reducing hydrogenase iron-sulfur subunit